MKTKFIFYITSLFLCASVFAQEPTSSLYHFDLQNLNPAETGIEENLHVSLSHRRQWISVIDRIYTSRLSIDAGCQYRKLINGIGLTFLQDKEGEGKFTTTIGNLALSRYTVISESMVLNVGMQFGIIQKVINYNQLVFSDQLDAVHGEYQPTQAPIENNQALILGNFSVGASSHKVWGSKFRKDQTKFGIGCYNLLRPEESIIKNSGINLPRKFTYFVLHEFNFQRRLKSGILSNKTFKTGVFTEINENLTTSSLLFGHQLNDAIEIGALVRHKWWKKNSLDSKSDAVVLYVSMYTDFGIIINASYDFTVSSLEYSNTRGGYELSLHWYFPDEVNFCFTTDKGSERKSCSAFDSTSKSNVSRASWGKKRKLHGGNDFSN
jgi:type IX secretion system PorP/SprF family membrane protein